MKSRAVVAWIASILLVASSFAHAFLGLPPLRASLRQLGADGDLMGDRLRIAKEFPLLNRDSLLDVAGPDQLP